MKKDLLFVLAVLCLLALPTLSTKGEWIADEMNFMNGALIMKEGGSPLIPESTHGMIRYAKPLLFYWMVLGSFDLLGVSLFAARLPSLLSAVAVLIFTYLMAREDGDGEKGLAAAWILSGGYLFFYHARTCLTDMAMTAGIAGGLYFFLRFLKDPSRWSRLYLSALLLGLAGMSKGPVALVLALLAILIYLIILKWRGAPNPSRGFLVRCLPPAALMLLLTGWWYIFMLMAFGTDFFSFHAGKEVAARIDLSLSRRLANLLYYLEKIFLTSLPWMAAFVFLLFRKGSDRVRRPSTTMSWCFIGGFFLFYTILVNVSVSRKYLVPLLPFLAVVVGGRIVEALRTGRDRRRVEWILRSVSSALLVLLLFAALGFLVLVRTDLTPKLALRASVTIASAALLLVVTVGRSSSSAPPVVPVVGMGMMLLFSSNLFLFQDSLNRPPMLDLAGATFRLEEGEIVDMTGLDYMERGLLYFFGDRDHIVRANGSGRATHRVLRAGDRDPRSQQVLAVGRKAEPLDLAALRLIARKGNLLSGRPRADSLYLVRLAATGD